MIVVVFKNCKLVSLQESLERKRNTVASQKKNGSLYLNIQKLSICRILTIAHLQFTTLFIYTLDWILSFMHFLLGVKMP